MSRRCGAPEERAPFSVSEGMNLAGGKTLPGFACCVDRSLCCGSQVPFWVSWDERCLVRAFDNPAYELGRTGEKVVETCRQYLDILKQLVDQVDKLGDSSAAVQNLG